MLMRMRLSFPFRLIAVTALVAAFQPVGRAQDCSVSTILRIPEDGGQPANNISADRLRAQINGSTASISSLSRRPKPGLILMLDDSSSMKSAWKESLAAARVFTERAGDDIEVVLFRERILSYVMGHSETEKFLDRLSTESPKPGGTALYDSLIDMASRVKTRDAVIVVISDGEDNASTHPADVTVSLLLRSSWLPVFALVLDYDRDHPGRREYFKKIPTQTGGQALYPSSPSDVLQATRELAATVFSPFTLTLRPPRPIKKGAKLKVEILGTDGKPRRDIHPLYAAELTGCELAEPAPASQK